ncbi:MAG: ACT domain-containing protein [Acidobacteriota bacterium]
MAADPPLRTIMKKLTLKLLPGDLAVWKVLPGAQMPSFPLEKPGFWSLTWTGEETSVVSDAEMVPPETTSQAGWRRFSVIGPLDFSMTGVLASLAVPLAEAEIPIFVISTFDTDHILVRKNQVNNAIKALKAAGHEIESGACGPSAAPATKKPVQ